MNKFGYVYIMTKTGGGLLEIPHCVRNDNATTASKGKSGGGIQEQGNLQVLPAAAALSPMPIGACHSEGAKRLRNLEPSAAALSSPLFAEQARHFERSEKPRTNEETLIKN